MDVRIFDAERLRRWGGLGSWRGVCKERKFCWNAVDARLGFWSQNSLVLLVTAYVHVSQKNVVVDYEKSHKRANFVWSDTYLGAYRVWNGYFIFVQIGRWYCSTA